MEDKKGQARSYMLVALVFVTLCSVGMVMAGDTASDNVNASLTMGNTAPTVSDCTFQNGGTYNPTSNTTTSIAVRLNVTDPNGIADIDESSLYVNVSRGAKVVNLTSCSTTGEATATLKEYECTGTMQYFYATGSWDANCSGSDVSAEQDTILAATNMTYNRLESVSATTSISWTGITVSSTDVGANDDPIQINNLGNAYFSTVNLTAIELVGATNASEKVAASDFSAGDLDASDQEAMVNNTAVTIVGASLLIGEDSNEEVYTYLEQITTPVSAQTYNSASPWIAAVEGAANENP